MRCRKIQRLLKSDYLDSELSQKEEKAVKEHLSGCLECRRIEEELKAQRVIFRDSQPKPVPEQIWHNIHSSILKEDLIPESSVFGSLIQRLKEAIFSPRPVFATATVLAVLVFALVFGRSLMQRKESADNNNRTELISEYNLNGESGVFIYTLGTNIEEYFL